ncbi:MAG: glycosyltransferase family 2 protein [Planctomycetes bacterium]|nr:glycosyltransferase family 2 protein [Planctomycetota bacterium]
MSESDPIPGPVSVVVVNFDGEAYLARCLDALRAAGPGIDEVLLVDNASSDRSLEIAARYPEVSVLRLARNEGPSPARNAGLRAARNRWVLLLDNDALLQPGALERLVAALRAAGPGVVLAEPRSVFANDPGRVHYDGGSLHYAGLIALRNFYVPLERAQGAGAVQIDCAVAVALLVDRERLLEIGGFDARYFILFEDLDLSYRLRARGWKLLAVEEALVQHLGGTSGISFREGPSYPARRVYLHSRNRWIYLLKNYRVWTLCVCSPGLALYEAAGFGFALLAGAPLAWLRGKLDCLRTLGELLRARSQCQRGRTHGDGSLLVGGPLTTTPDAMAGGARRRLQRALDLALRTWWALARRLIPR